MFGSKATYSQKNDYVICVPISHALWDRHLWGQHKVFKEKALFVELIMQNPLHKPESSTIGVPDQLNAFVWPFPSDRYLCALETQEPN